LELAAVLAAWPRKAADARFVVAHPEIPDADDGGMPTRTHRRGVLRPQRLCAAVRFEILESGFSAESLAEASLRQTAFQIGAHRVSYKGPQEYNEQVGAIGGIRIPHDGNWITKTITASGLSVVTGGYRLRKIAASALGLQFCSPARAGKPLPQGLRGFGWPTVLLDSVCITCLSSRLASV
jgi:hypothetical protein